jgi:tetratricopeptide (TPR) repeat protein
LPNELRITSEFLKPLASLAFIQQGAPGYYRPLKDNADPYIAVGAWCALLDGKLAARSFWDGLLPYCRYAGVRTKAFRYFEGLYERDLARKVAETPVDSPAEIEQRLMLADVDYDSAAAAEAEAQMFLATGDVNRLVNASIKAEVGGGWRAALGWAVRAVAIAPLNPSMIQRLFIVLESSAQPDILDEVAQIFTSRNMYLQISQIFSARAALMRGDAEGALKRLNHLDDVKVTSNKALAPYLGAIRALRAEAEDKLGHYRKAYDAYVALNAAEKDASIDPEHFYKGVVIRSKINVPPLPPDAHPEVVQMLGFPRSGTTLLENALNAHPDVETFEEMHAFTIAVDRIEQVLQGKIPVELPEATFIAARARYYDEVLSMRRKDNPHVLIDKLPIRSAEAAFIGKLFPEWRYIFSIRHPFDVVLSCFKQRFAPNPAMENFRTIEQTVRLYDFTMNEWFAHHTMDDPKVHYVRYDELVTDFETVMSSALQFLGLEWNDEVRDFARAAEKRAVKTPSYQKVRQGLSIGVQTAWKNYDFVFKSAAAKPLHKWAEFLGYPTT